MTMLRYRCNSLSLSPSLSPSPSLSLVQGFKHKSFVVQVAAYTAWKSLVSNFSLQLGETLLCFDKKSTSLVYGHELFMSIQCSDKLLHTCIHVYTHCRSNDNTKEIEASSNASRGGLNLSL